MPTITIQKLENLLFVAVPADLADEEVLYLREMTLEEIRRCKSRWVLLDFSRVDICDSFFGRFIQDMSTAARLIGAEVIVSGLKNAVVVTMVYLGMTLPNIHTALDIDGALALSREMDRAAMISDGQTPDESAATTLSDSLRVGLAFADSILSDSTEIDPLTALEETPYVE